MVRGALSDDHLIQLKMVTGTLNAQKYQDEILESGVRSSLDSLDGQNITVCIEIRIGRFLKAERTTQDGGPFNTGKVGVSLYSI